MIVRDFNELKNTDRAVSDAQWTSVRLLLADDGMGFSFHITTLKAGSEHTFHYKNHFESVYCMSGTGSITDLASGKTHQIRPGVMYGFNPPVTGKEVHRADGSYAAPDEVAD
jgi:L-ectoine synthase